MSQTNCFQIDFGTPLYDWYIDMRTEVLRIPLGLEFYQEDIAKEHHFHHYICLDACGELLAGCMIVPLDKDTVKMRQVATMPEYQGKGFGTQLAQYVENDLKRKGYSQIILHARDVAVPFYQKLQYQIFDEPFEEVGIPHRKMKKQLLQ